MFLHKNRSRTCFLGHKSNFWSYLWRLTSFWSCANPTTHWAVEGSHFRLHCMWCHTAIIKYICINRITNCFILLILNHVQLSSIQRIKHWVKHWLYNRCSKILNTSCRLKAIDKQCKPRPDCFFRSSLIRVFSVCYSYTHFVNFCCDNQHMIWKQKLDKCSTF